MTDLPNPLLTTGEAAEYLRVSSRWLAHSRHHEPGAAPPFVQVGRRIYYRVTDLDTWIGEHGALDIHRRRP
ncbi:MAG: helix-turn-helix domain-containing protein [Propionibacteriaceae bacterium]|jgi:hypothetical protein|nr:helix-turn-helix domain-containing protein [Propionibacteriaceae bacterium]